MEEQKMYIGPNIASLGLLKNQVYLGDIPGQVRAAIAVYPDIEQLIVPVSSLPESAQAVKTKGTHLHHVYNELLRKAGKA